MYNQLMVKIGTEEHCVFLQDGFYVLTETKPLLHKHNYAEIHIVSGGTAEFHIGNQIYTSTGSTLLIIPANVFHFVKYADPDVRHTAFQIEYDAQSFAVKHASTQTVLDFMDEIQTSRSSDNYTTVVAYISLFCNLLFPKEVSVQPIRDYRFLISEFFTQHYHEDLHLCDLAKALCLSERQTERLVLQATGHTFRQELTSVRINVAKYLLKTTTMSLEKIAYYIGYRSYSGFWKAMQKHGI